MIAQGQLSHQQHQKMGCYQTREIQHKLYSSIARGVKMSTHTIDATTEMQYRFNHLGIHTDHMISSIS